MARSTPPRWFSCFAFIAAVSLATAASAECPQSTASCVAKDYAEVVVFEDTKASDAPAAVATYGRLSSASYDRIERTVQAEANVYRDEAYRHVSRATAMDRFELRGVASALVTIRLWLTATGAWDGGRQTWMRGSAHLASVNQTANAWGILYFDPFIEIQGYVVEGEPIDIIYETTAEAWGDEPFLRVSGRLEFIGLPEGAELAPCVTTTAVEPRTWGAVKAYYR